MSDVFAKRIVDPKQIKVDDVVFLVCMGNIQTVLITSKRYKDMFWKRDFIDLDTGHKGHFYEGDRNLGVSGGLVVLNGVFRAYEDAKNYINTSAYKHEHEKWKRHIRRSSSILFGY